jgi:hypothetical protein
MNRISDEKIKAIAAEYLTNGMVKTKALITVGYSKNYADHGGLKLFDNDRLKDEIAHQQAKIAAKTGITVAYCQNLLLQLADKAKAKGHYGVARSCISDLIKTIGGFQADRQPAVNLARKALNAKTAEELRRFADSFYAHKYLAVKQVESKEIMNK